MKRISIFVLLLAITYAFPVNAQVMWNLKGGIMQRSVYHFPDYSYYTFSHDDADLKKRIDWMAGLELEIPLSSKLNLETGVRYKNHYSLVNLDDEYENNWRNAHWAEATTHFELPLRLTYKQPLGEHFSLHVGVGPYASYAVGDDFGEKWDNNLQVGLEPSIAINWACLSLGATYNIPCFYKGYKDENDPVVMATLGIRFKSHVWKYVGATLLAIASVGAAAAAVWPSNDSYSSYSSGSYSPSYSSSSSSSSSSSVGKSCKFCAGSGECRSLTDKYHCRGTGECKKCYGKGYDTLNGHPYKCGYCNGSGKCKFCGGSGKCKHCGGTGRN